MSADGHLDSSELFRRYGRFVAAFMTRMGVPQRDLDDLMQDVFLVAHKNGGYEPGPAKPTTYLANIAFKAVISHRRKARTRGFVRPDDEAVDRAAGAQGTAHDVREREQKLEILGQLLDTLDDDKRAIFVLTEIQGETVVAAAQILGINLDTAYSRLRAARQRFRQAASALGDDQLDALTGSVSGAVS